MIVVSENMRPESAKDACLSAQENAEKTIPALRLLRKTIAEVAEEFDEVGADSRQIGIQFCQIGDDEGATIFFEYLEEQLKSR